MPRKEKGSAGRAVAGAAARGSREAALARAQFEQDSWRACVCLVVGSSAADEERVQALASALQRSPYKLFTVLNWDQTLAKIHELGNPKTKKHDSMPQFYEVTESAKLLLDAGEEIPCDLMAKIIKFQLLQIKADDQQRRDVETAEKERANVAPPSASKEKGAFKGSDKKGKNPLSPVDYSREKSTRLKRRDDVDPPTFKDEEPHDGPQHYILVLGFHQPHLIGALDALGVHVANVIRLCSGVQQDQHTSEASEQSQVKPPDLDSDSVRMEQPALDRKLHLFWSGLRPVLDSAPLNSKLHDVAQLSYTVPDVLPSSHTQDPEAVLEVGWRILEGVARLIFDCVHWRRQYRHYLDNLELLSVPAVVGLDSQPLEVVPAPLPTVPVTPRSRIKSVQEENPPHQETRSHLVSTNVDMCYYNNLLDLVPPEACSVPLILHCVLEQVVISTEQPVSEEPKPYDEPCLDHQLVSYMLQSFLPLVHTEDERSAMLNSLLTTVRDQEDRKKLMQKFGSETSRKKLEQPLVLRHHDERGMRLKDVGAVEGFDAAEVELSMMRLSPAWGLIESVARERNRNSRWTAIKQQLQHFCTDDVVSWPEVKRLLYQSVLESMPLTRLDQKGVLLKTVVPPGALKAEQQQTPTIIPWDNPLDYAKQQLRKLRAKGQTCLTQDPDNTKRLSERVCSQVDLSGIQSCRLRSLFDWHYSEHHSAAVFPQVLQLAFEEYCCLDTFRGSHNNVLYIFCHNPMSPRRQCKEFWDVALHTDVKFRKYLEHVADTVSDWTREEELKREETSLVGCTQDEEAPDAAEEVDILDPVIRKDSLKAWKLEQEQLKKEELAKKLKKDNVPKAKQPTEEDKITDNEKSKTLSGVKKSRSETAVSSVKTPSEFACATAPPVVENVELHQTEEPFKHFTGYSMNGKLIHLSGCLQHLFPSDGGQIAVENVSYVEGSSLVKLAVKKDGHHFHTHINRVVVDPAKPPAHLQDEDTGDKNTDRKVAESVEMKLVKQGSLSAKLNNGIHLSYSFYGPTGQYTVSPQEAGRAIPESSTPVPVALCASVHRSMETEVYSISSRIQTEAKVQAPESQSTACDLATLPSKPFNSLHLSVPNGLFLQFLREDTQGVPSEEQGMLVRQSFPLHGEGEGRQLQDRSLFKELSRVVTSQGAVIRVMRDGSTQVLFADGSVSFSQDCGPVWVSDSEIDKTSQEAEDNSKEQSSHKDAQRGCWTTTTPSGARVCTVGTTHKHIPASPLLAFKATDPITHEVMLSREDLVVSVQKPDGSLIVEHADGTRITSIFQSRPPSTPRDTLPHTGDQPEGLKSTCECVCGCTECVCVTRCADSINGNMHIQDTCGTGEDITEHSAETGYDRDICAQTYAKLSECDHMCNEQERAESSACRNIDQSVLAEETSAKFVKRRVCEGGKLSESTKERVVVVEKEGCATVAMYPERHTAQVFLADGTVITGNNQGDFQVFPSSVGLLHIQSDGTCVYTSNPLVSPSPKRGTSTNPPESYTFSHSNKVACDMTDPAGNHFQVTEDGQVSVLNFSPASSTLKPDEEELEEEDKEIGRIHVNNREHCPRLFVVHEDGSATELLSSQTVDELLYQARSDTTVSLLKEPLPDTQDEFGITILKPSLDVWSRWLLDKQSPDVTPPNLRNRSWHDFPRVEAKTQGPPFGTDMGRGLTLREFGGTSARCQSVKSCPKVLEMRELYEHRSLSTSLRNTVDTRLKEFIESLMVREQRSEESKVKDPRPEEENAHASDLLSLVLSYAEEDGAGPTFDKRTPEDIAGLYSKGVGAELSDVSDDTVTAASGSFTNEKESKWPERLAEYRHEMSEEKACREALRKKNIVPYFHSENIPIYQDLLQHQTPDMRALSMDLPPIPKSDSAELFLKDAPQDTPRPLNPTPSARCAAGLDWLPEKSLTNRTPQMAGESSLKSSAVPCKSVQVDVTGKPRKTKVRLPSSILGSKPRSVPNQQFLSLEEPVRRKCRTISLTDSSAVARGFVLLRSRVDFGTLQEGTSSAITVVMKNVGVDTCRFHVKQPPPATGLRVVYNPGPVAAGLQVALKVQLFAMCAVQTGAVEPETYISQDIIIHTETDILYLPVTATILPKRLHELWLRDRTSAHKRGSRLTKPAA